MFQDLTLQQFCALDYNRNMVVTAGPGAGKTGILSKRFCFILLTDPSVLLPQILTLTFTEKAAEEMKGRIYKMISRIERELGSGHDEQVFLRIREARERFNTNRISTIHSFCADLLRENPVESNIDPGFVIIQGAKQKEVMEESIESAVSAIWRTNRDLLSPLLRSFGSRKNLIAAIDNLIGHPMTFQHAVKTAGHLFGTAGWTNQVFRDYCRCIRDENILPYYEGLREIDSSKEIRDELINLFEEWSINSGKDQDYFGIPELFASLRRLYNETKDSCSRLMVGEGIKKISYDDLIEEFYPDVIRCSSPDSIFEREFKLFIEVAGICLKQYQHAKRGINSLDFADLEKECHSFLTQLSGNDHLQLARIRRGFKYVMVDEFQDTNMAQWDIIRLLCTQKRSDSTDELKPGKLFVVGDKRQAIYRFRGGDVTVFESVTEKIKESNSQKHEIFFRQPGYPDDLLTTTDKGYPDLKTRHAEAYESLTPEERERILSGDVYLPHNFRTDGRPIDFFNSVFKEIFGNKNASKMERYETAHREIIMPDIKKSSGARSGSVSIYLTTLARQDSAGKEAALIADILEGILGRKGIENREYLEYGDIRQKIRAGEKAIGVLLFRFSHIKTFEAILREAGLPFMIYRGKGFYRCQEVMEIVQLLNYISDDRQIISLLSVVRSPMFGLEDAEVFDLFYGGEVSLDSFSASDNAYVRLIGNQLMSWRFLANRLTIPELIRTIITDRGLTAIHSAHPNGGQRKANIEKLIETARRFQSEGSGSLPDFVEYCLRMADEEEEEGEAPIITGEGCPITLMTVHAAKGLEFPMVIVPDLDHRPPARTGQGVPLRLYPSEDGDRNKWNSDEGVIPVWQVEIPEFGYQKKHGPLGWLLNRRNRLEDMAENRRVFYVACTRAMNHLVLIGSMKKRHMEKDFISLSSEDYRERASILDILNDIYRFNPDHPLGPEESCSRDGDAPSVFWREPELRTFRGLNYKDGFFSQNDFGKYNERIAKNDLTSPIISPSYFQLSFKTLCIYKECPRKFYFEVILGVRPEENDYSGTIEEAESTDKQWVKEDDEMDFSGDALMLGLIVHGYLERHRFGEGLNTDLFDSIWEKSLAGSHTMNDCTDDILRTLRRKAIDQLERTINDERLIRALSGSQDYSEAPFLINLSRGVDFRGVIDRVFRNKDNGCWSIIDWKSNELRGRHPSEVAEEKNYHLQLACYKYAVEDITKEKVDGLYIYFTDAGHMLQSDFSFDAGDIIKGIGKKIVEHSGSGLPPRGFECDDAMLKCRFCGYREGFCKV
jgi:ATP-dependent helicase/nuclease subunit A